MTLFGIVGAGGFGREVMPVAEEMLRKQRPEQPYQIVFVVESGFEAGVKEKTVNGYPVMSDDEFLAAKGEKNFNIAIADYAARERIAKRFIDRGACPFSIVASNSVNLSHNVIGEGSIICPFVSVTANVKIGKFFHANIYSYVAHDCIIGDFVTFAPGVKCNGRVVIEDGAYIGTGVCIKPGSDEKPMVIGRGAVVGMGAVVTKSVEPLMTVVGNPAIPLVRKTP